MKPYGSDHFKSKRFLKEQLYLTKAAFMNVLDCKLTAAQRAKANTVWQLIEEMRK